MQNVKQMNEWFSNTEATAEGAYPFQGSGISTKLRPVLSTHPFPHVGWKK